MTAGEFLFAIGTKNIKAILGIVPGCGGTESPLRNRDGKLLLYCFDLLGVTHFYLDTVGNKWEDIDCNISA